MFTIALTITAAAFLALLYADGSLHKLQRHFSSSELQPPALVVPEVQGTTPTAVTAPPQTRSNRILECTTASGERFYTNAASCNEADLNNTISVIGALPRPVVQSHATNTVAQKPAPSSSTVKQVTEWTAAALPSSMSVGCRWAIGRAQEIERSLNLKNAPQESSWIPNYCRWVREAKGKQCGSLNPYLEHSMMCVN